MPPNGAVNLTGYEDSPEGPKPIAGVLCMLFIKDYCFAYEPVCV